jgi:translation initiation factor 2B subunit (eIF-2B alpha/beta/delta family)
MLIYEDQVPSPISEFIHNRTAGAAELALRALEIFKEIVATSTFASTHHKIKLYSTMMLEAQASMASVLNTILRITEASDKALADSNPEFLCLAIDDALVNFKAEQDSTIEAATQTLLQYSTVATFSRSSLVEKTLMRIKKEKKELKAILSESHPCGEGKTLAENLRKAGIEVLLCADRDLPNMMSQSEAFIVGADAITSRAFCNKIGTEKLCQIAHRHQLPNFVIATNDKILTSQSEKLFKINEELFEWSPSDIIRGFVLGEKVYTPKKLSTFIKRMESAPQF